MADDDYQGSGSADIQGFGGNSDGLRQEKKTPHAPTPSGPSSSELEDQAGDDDTPQSQSTQQLPRAGFGGDNSGLNLGTPSLDTSGSDDDINQSGQSNLGDVNDPNSSQQSSTSDATTSGGGVKGAIQKAGHGISKTYGAVSGGIAKGLVTVTGHALKEKTAKHLSHIVTIGMLGLGGTAVYSSWNVQRPLDGGFVCQTTNDDGDTYVGSVAGAEGAWTQKGTKEYNTAKRIYQYGISVGLDAAHAAAMVGNGAEEGGGFVDLAQKQIGGGPGVGIFQFNNPPSDMSPEGQAKAILANKLRGIDAAGFNNQTGSIAELAEYFRQDFEGGDQNPLRAINSQKAYEMFKGLPGSSDLNAANANASNAESLNDANCSGQSDSDDSGASGLIGWGKKLLGYFTYKQDPGGGVRANVNNIKANDVSSVDKAWTADCSSYVYTVMKLAGYKVPASAWGTMDMQTDADGSQQYLKRVSSAHGWSQASQLHGKAGDILIVNVASGAADDGHTAILEEDWHGGDTKIVEEGGGSDLSVNESTVTYAFLSLLPQGEITIAQPVGK